MMVLEEGSDPSGKILGGCTSLKFFGDGVGGGDGVITAAPEVRSPQRPHPHPDPLLHAEYARKYKVFMFLKHRLKFSWCQDLESLILLISYTHV